MFSREILGTIGEALAVRGVTSASGASFPYGLCAFDVDGTLRQSNDIVSPRVKAALAAVRARGAAVGLATGRPSSHAGDLPLVCTILSELHTLSLWRGWEAMVGQEVGGEIDYIVTSNGLTVHQIANDGTAASLAPAAWIEQVGRSVVST
jgi:hypothetical protein